MKKEFANLSRGKVISLFVWMLLLVSLASAQAKPVGKLDTWTFNKVSSREKDDEVLPISYKMRVSKNKGSDRIVFEFEETEVPEYTVYFTKPPITIDPVHLENASKPKKDEIIKVKGNAFVIVDFALGFRGKDAAAKFAGEQDLTVVQDIESVDWFENFFSIAVGLRSRKMFRVQELSNPTRLVVDFKY